MQYFKPASSQMCYSYSINIKATAHAQTPSVRAFTNPRQHSTYPAKRHLTGRHAECKWCAIHCSQQSRAVEVAGRASKSHPIVTNGAGVAAS